jgi:hypothetical protein
MPRLPYVFVREAPDVETKVRPAAVAPEWERASLVMIVGLLISALAATVLLVSLVNRGGTGAEKAGLELFVMPLKLIILPLVAAYAAFKFGKHNSRAFNRTLCGVGGLMLAVTWGGAMAGYASASQNSPGNGPMLSPVYAAPPAPAPTADRVMQLADRLTGDEQIYVNASMELTSAMHAEAAAYQTRFAELSKEGALSPQSARNQAQLDQQTDVIVQLVEQAQHISDGYDTFHTRLADILAKRGASRGFVERVRNHHVVFESMMAQLEDLRRVYACEVGMLKKAVERNMLLSSQWGKWSVDAHDGALIFSTDEGMKAYAAVQECLDSLAQLQAEAQQRVAGRGESSAAK